MCGEGVYIESFSKVGEGGISFLALVEVSFMSCARFTGDEGGGRRRRRRRRRIHLHHHLRDNVDQLQAALPHRSIDDARRFEEEEEEKEVVEVEVRAVTGKCAVKSGVDAS